MVLNWQLHAYAIVSRDDCIADADGVIPESLQNDADWAYFQDELDRSRAVLVGRAAHDATPNRSGRLRLIMSRSAPGLEQREDGWWWNPASVPLTQVLARAVPDGGRIGVPGGRGPFDYLLATRQLDAFHLSRAGRVSLPGGVPVFSACNQGTSAIAVLKTAGMRAGSSRYLDPNDDVALTVWQKAARPTV